MERPDFSSGFEIIEKVNRRANVKKPAMPVYEIREIKEATHCPYCGSTFIKKINKGRYTSHWVYAVVNDNYAHCNLLRWEYRCYDCVDYTVFFNTEIPEAYKNTDTFSRNFVRFYHR